MKEKLDQLLNRSKINKSGFVGAIDKYGNIIDKNPLPNYLQLVISILLLALFIFLSIKLFSFFISAIGFIALCVISIYILDSFIPKVASTINLQIKIKALSGFLTMILLAFIATPIVISFMIVKFFASGFKGMFRG